jgi:hypothetical protein
LVKVWENRSVAGILICRPGPFYFEGRGPR